MQTNTRPVTILQEQLTFIIRRSPNTGLGISIAGGIGSTPFKDDDHVRRKTKNKKQKLSLINICFLLGHIFNKSH